MKLYQHDYVNNSTAVGCVGVNTHQSIIINTETLQLKQRDLGITIDIPNEILNNIETIEVNGFVFKKEETTNEASF